MLEETLVDKLATLSWRYRRLVIAEAAEIQKRAAFLEWNKREHQEKEALETSVGAGLMPKMANPRVLDRCLDLLEQLKDEFEINGFDSGFNKEVLTKLYGYQEHAAETLLEVYEAWGGTAECSDKDREQKGYSSAEECKEVFAVALEVEIKRLEQYKKTRASMEQEKTRLESLRQSVPDAPQLDRLLRYEANLERNFDRTLTQLERFQRMRLGQPVASPIKLDISSS